MRKKFGGSKKKNFTEGWVEFLDKRVAKAVARTLNSMPIGGQKRNYYHDDLWNIKYLPKFKWGHLTEKIGMCRVYSKNKTDRCDTRASESCEHQTIVCVGITGVGNC